MKLRIKRIIYAVAAILLVLSVAVGRFYYRNVVVPDRIADALERNDGWIDDDEPPKEFRIDHRLRSADEDIVYDNLPQMHGLKALTLAESSPVPAWAVEHLDLSNMEELSISFPAGTASIDVFHLLNAAPKLQSLELYRVDDRTAEVEKIGDECLRRKISFNAYATDKGPHQP